MKKHEYVGTSLYRSWYHMKDRCSNTNNKCYTYYGGRGISFCKEWYDFLNFKEWAIKNGYAPSLTLDRIDNDSGYNPQNCRWATRKEQSLNQRRIVLYKGEASSDASRRLGGSESLVKARLKLGWSPEDAFNIPLNRKKQNFRKC